MVTTIVKRMAYCNAMQIRCSMFIKSHTTSISKICVVVVTLLFGLENETPNENQTSITVNVVYTENLILMQDISCSFTNVCIA